MEKILLFSNDEKLVEITNRIIEKKYELIWRTHQLLKKNEYPYANVVIMHFDKEMTRKGTFESIIKVKGKLGHSIPILVIIEGGTTQDIYSALKTGVYDYIETTDDLQKYQKKIEDLILWNWYLKKYEFEEKSNDRKR